MKIHRFHFLILSLMAGLTAAWFAVIQPGSGVNIRHIRLGMSPISASAVLAMDPRTFSHPLWSFQFHGFWVHEDRSGQLFVNFEMSGDNEQSVKWVAGFPLDLGHGHRIVRGMSSDEVRSLLGSPSREFDQCFHRHKRVWQYDLGETGDGPVFVCLTFDHDTMQLEHAVLSTRSVR